MAENQGIKIRIRLKAYDHKVIDQSAKQIIDTALRTGADVAGPIPLPTRRSTYTVVKSPHVYKMSSETYEMRVHKRLIDITSATPKTTVGPRRVNPSERPRAVAQTASRTPDRTRTSQDMRSSRAPSCR